VNIKFFSEMGCKLVISFAVLALFIIATLVVIIKTALEGVSVNVDELKNKPDCKYEGLSGKCVQREMCHEPSYQIMERDDSEANSGCTEALERNIICCPFDLLTPSKNKNVLADIEESGKLEMFTSNTNETAEDSEFLKEKKKLLNHITCGTSSSMVDRIVGGTKAYPGQYRFYVGLMYNVEDSLVILCGGSLISGKQLSFR
jgi:hypothetical protein